MLFHVHVSYGFSQFISLISLLNFLPIWATLLNVEEKITGNHKYIFGYVYLKLQAVQGKWRK